MVLIMDPRPSQHWSAEWNVDTSSGSNSSQNSSDVHGSDININAILDPSQANAANVKFRVTLLPLLPNTEKTAAQAYAYFEKKGSQKVRNSNNWKSRIGDWSSWIVPNIYLQPLLTKSMRPNMQPNRARNLDAVKIASSDIKNDAYKSSSLVKLVSSSRYIGMMHNPLLPVCSIVQSPIPYSEVSAEASCAFDGIKPTSTFTKVQSKFEIIDKTKAIARKVAAAHFLYLNRKVIEFESMYVHLISSSEYAKNRHDEER